MAETKQKYIRLTRKAVSEMFDECNHLYFNDSVEKPKKIETWTPYKTAVGMVRPIRWGKHREVGSVLHISRQYRWTAENLRRVVVHEMIHLSIGDYKRPLTTLQRLPLIGRFFIKGHDEDFIALMNELNEKYDLGIKVRIKEMRKERIR